MAAIVEVDGSPRYMAALCSSLSVADAFVDDFFLLCRRINIMKIPIRARTATPPIAAPTIRPVDGPEADEELAAEVAEGAVDRAVDCEIPEFEVTVASVEPGERDDGVGTTLPFALDEVTTGVDSALLIDCTALGRGVVEIAGVALGVGVSDSMTEGKTAPTLVGLDRNEDSSPPMLDSMLPICLRCKWY